MKSAVWCLGSDEMRRATAEAFGCECLARGRGATDTVGSVEAIQAILDKSQNNIRSRSRLGVSGYEWKTCVQV